MRKALFIAAILLLAIGSGLALSGETFGARCREAFTDPFDIDDCIDRLKHGGRLRSPTPTHPKIGGSHEQ